MASPLDNLHDVIAPQTVSWWPLSPVAFMLLACLLLVLGALFFLMFKRAKLLKAKKAAVKLCQDLDSEDINAIQQRHLLLKRLVKHYYGASQANVTGVEWLATIKACSKISISHDELNLIYAEPTNDAMCENFNHKLKLAIKRFKVKGALNV